MKTPRRLPIPNTLILALLFTFIMMGQLTLPALIVGENLDIQGTVEVDSEVNINGKTALRGTDTWLRLNPDGEFTSGVYTNRFFRVDNAVVINENGGNYDFRIEGDLDVNLLRTDASVDRVGIGIGTPTTKLDVNGNLLVRTSLVVNNNAVFNENSGNYDFRVESDGNSNMLFVDASTNRIGIGHSAPSSMLDVNGDIETKGLDISLARGAHWNKDGAFYRYAGQAYITVDDNFYIRDTISGNGFHFDTNNKILKINGNNALTTASSLSWSKLTGIPAELADGDNQTLSWDEIASELTISGGNTINLTGLSGGSGSSIVNLGDLSDVTISTPADGQVIVHNGTRWINGSLNLSWADISGKPTEFTPAAHGHAQTDVTGLSAALDGKVDTTGANTINGSLNVNNTLWAMDVSGATITGASVAGNEVIAETSMVGTETLDAGKSFQVVGDTKLEGDIEITGTVDAQSFASGQFSRIVPFHVQGSGPNRLTTVKFGADYLYESVLENGLHVTLISNYTYEVWDGVGSTDPYFPTYDVSVPAEAQAMADFINTIHFSETVIIASSGNWGGAIPDVLKPIFRDYGLYKGASANGNCGAYAAILRGKYADENSVKAIEVMMQSTPIISSYGYAEITGFLVDGEIVASGSVDNTVANAMGNISALVADEAANIGIGTDSPLARLHVKTDDADPVNGISVETDGLVVEGPGDTGISVITGQTGTPHLTFGKGGILRTFKWDDTQDEWFVEDSTGIMQRIIHEGNIGSSASNIVTLDSWRFEDSTNFEISNSEGILKYVFQDNGTLTARQGLAAGDQIDSYGFLELYGNAFTHGGQISIYNSGDYLTDGVVPYFQIEANGDLEFKSQDTTVFRIKSDGDLLASGDVSVNGGLTIGNPTKNASMKLQVKGYGQIEGEFGVLNHQMYIKSSAPTFNFYRPYYTNINQTLGHIYFYGKSGDGTDNLPATISVKADALLTNTELPASIIFETGKNSATRVEQMRINSDGNVGIGTSGASAIEAKLHVAGNVKIDGTLTVQATGDIPMITY